MTGAISGAALVRQAGRFREPTMRPAIGCIRVSTAKQGSSGLGIEAQQEAFVERSRSRPWAASILAWRYKGRCQPYLATSTEATMVSVGSPDLIRCSGAGACTIRSQARQASLGRCVTITRYWAGITSSRSERLVDSQFDGGEQFDRTAPAAASRCR